tara:strand:+ start:315 stop:590 length:276 start_codon:yes stop_codon:yes gene_type:complete
MTNNQFIYIWKRFRQHLKSKGMSTIRKQELKGFLAMMDVHENTPLAAHEFADRALLEFDKFISKTNIKDLMGEKVNELATLVDELKLNLEE